MKLMMKRFPSFQLQVLMKFQALKLLSILKEMMTLNSIWTKFTLYTTI